MHVSLGIVARSPSPHVIQFAADRLGVRGERLQGVPLLAGVGVRGKLGLHWWLPLT